MKTETFAIRRVGRKMLEKIRPGDVIFAYLSGLKVIAGMFEAAGEAFEDTTPLVAGGRFPHRLRVRPIVTLSEESWVPYEAYCDKLDVTQDYPDFRAVVQKVIHPLPGVDEKVLAFLVRARQASDLEKVFTAYDAYLKARAAQAAPEAAVREPSAAYTAAPPFDLSRAVEDLIRYIEARGFVYEPWQVAAYVAALRTKPFVILAGVSGTGKSKLPALVEAGTGGEVRLVPVRPDWTDSAEALGYTDLQGRFRPGAVLSVARYAAEHPGCHVTCILDEMNVARVEHYFAEILSRIEDRRPAARGGFESAPLLGEMAGVHEESWLSVRLGPNLALVGTVNMDESAHGFSRKVMDRAFTLELADVDLQHWPAAAPEEPEPGRWPVAAWFPDAGARGEATVEHDPVHTQRVLTALMAANRFLLPAQLQVAYRTRDEMARFVRHAAGIEGAFRTREGAPVDPLDLALHMKLLPRLTGGSGPVRAAVLGLLGWAAEGAGYREESAASGLLDAWDRAGRPLSLPDALFPRTAARLCLMWDRLRTEGFTSFWV